MGFFARRHQEQPDEFLQEERLSRWIDRVRRNAPISDAALDEIYPSSIQQLSRTHWTPIEVIRRATSLLVTFEGTRVLDVGSGVGKFCLVGALVSKGRFTGIEQRPHFVELANQLVSRYKIPRVNFIHGNFKALDWTAFHSIYLFNPFQENKTPDQRLDNAVPLSRELYSDYVSATTEKLEQMPSGTRVVTYHGFGGNFPSSYERHVSEWCYRGPLELWIKS
jgi:predicted RNA methylase